MTDIYITILTGLGGVLLGFVFGRTLITRSLKKKIDKMKEQGQIKAKNILQEADNKAERIKKNKLLELREIEATSRSSAKQQYENNRKKLASTEKRLSERENVIKNEYQKVLEKEKSIQTWRNEVQEQKQKYFEATKLYQQKKEELKASKQELLDKKGETEDLQQEYLQKMAELSGKDIIEVEETFEKELEKKLQEQEQEAVNKVTEIIQEQTTLRIQEVKEKAELEGKKILINAIQKSAVQHIKVIGTTLFKLNSNEEKGKIIGREGRNIKALESFTGTKLVIDKPATVTISSFDPYKREITKLALEKIIQKGLIDVKYIETVVKEVKNNMTKSILELGQQLLKDLKIENMNLNLISLVSKMRLYTNGNYNLLEHVKEVVEIAVNLAAELDLDINVIKRIALLHDIGKVSQDDKEKHHALVSMELAKRHGEKEEVYSAIGDHHEDEPMNIMSAVVQIANDLSNNRSGAPTEPKDNFKRVKKVELKDIPLSFHGVKKSYTLEANKKLYVIVDAEVISDEQAYEMSQKITKKIDNSKEYGKVKVIITRTKEIAIQSS